MIGIPMGESATKDDIHPLPHSNHGQTIGFDHMLIQGTDYTTLFQSVEVLHQMYSYSLLAIAHTWNSLGNY